MIERHENVFIPAVHETPTGALTPPRIALGRP